LKKQRKYDKVKAVKEIARKRIGSPPPPRTIDEKSARAKPKHKKPWTEEGTFDLET
jgi:hypothetical protein